MARSLAQALKGISFPCGRGRLIEYAQTKNADPKAMRSLTAIPERRYRDLAEVLAAIPSEQQIQPWANHGKLADALWPAAPRPDPMTLWISGWALMSHWVHLWRCFWFPWMR